MSTEKPLVVVTGISGFLGAHVCLACLKDESFRVRGTVRSISNEAKIKPLKDGFGELFDKLELVEADLTDEASLVNACAGAAYVIHTASPFNFKGDCVGPAVAGTNAIMKACTAHSVKKLVITSSCVAIQCPAKEDAPPQGTPYTEANWSNPDRPGGLMDYFKSKTLAEKAAWDYQAANPGFDLSCINPVFILGPSFGAGGDGVSEGWYKSILTGEKTEIPRGGMGMVDVRDVALAHLKCLQVPEAANKRFILSSHRVIYKDIYGWFAAKYNDKGGKVATTMAEGDDPTTFDLLDNTRSKEVLGIVYTDMEKTMIDGAESLIALGQIKLG
jgi:dihydroflavonol-4-reductase